jgi:hypothetical protein
MNASILKFFNILKVKFNIKNAIITKKYLLQSSVIFQRFVDTSLCEELWLLVVVELVSDCVFGLVIHSDQGVPSWVVDLLLQVKRYFIVLYGSFLF